MRGNSGIIGKKLTPSKTLSSGIFDTYDNFNSRKSNDWPLVIKYLSLSYNSGNILENTSQSITFNTEGFIANTTLYWTVLHGNSNATDFYASLVSGSFTQNSSTNTGTFNVVTAFTGNTSKTAKTFQIQIRTGSPTGPVVYTSGTYTIPAITISSLYFNPTTSNENATSNLYFQCGNCGTYGSSVLTLTNTGTITSADISGGLPTSWTISSPGSLNTRSYTILNDYTTEGTETLTVQVSFGGFNLGTAQTLTVNDTSLAPTTGTITPSTTSVTEGNSITFTCTMNNSYTGTVYYTINNITGTMNTADFVDATLSGGFAMTNGSASFSKTLIADGLVEGEAFTASLRYGSISGTIFATTATISVIDANPPAAAQAEYTTPGTYSWTCPTGVTSVSAVCIGGGGGGMEYTSGNGNYPMNGGGGGGLGWKNNISVTPGTAYTVVVGAGGLRGPYNTGSTAGGDSYFINTSTVRGGGGQPGRYSTSVAGGTYTGDGGGNGGGINTNSSGGPSGGGGAGGYAGAGGLGGYASVLLPTAGAGGGGGGGGNNGSSIGHGGGGTGIYGQGANGSAGSSTTAGGGGSGGTAGSVSATSGGSAGNFGGGGGGCNNGGNLAANGAGGAVRLIWGGSNRAFPSTNTGNL
jgi:hypothetical protein